MIQGREREIVREKHCVEDVERTNKAFVCQSEENDVIVVQTLYATTMLVKRYYCALSVQSVCMYIL